MLAARRPRAPRRARRGESISATKTACAACQSTSDRHPPMAVSASGTTANVHHGGIASAFAIGDTSDTCWNSASVPGTSATGTTGRRGARRSATHARSPHAKQVVARRTDPVPAYSSTPTAPNDSQNPGVNPAQGSQASTMASDHSQTTRAVPGARPSPRRPRRRASAACAPPAPAHRQAARRRGETQCRRRRDPACGNARRQRSVPPGQAKARPPASAANTVTCSPEMLIRCAMPVRLNTAHSRFGNGALLADRERDDHARIARVRQRREDARADVFPGRWT